MIMIIIIYMIINIGNEEINFLMTQLHYVQYIHLYVGFMDDTRYKVIESGNKINGFSADNKSRALFCCGQHLGSHYSGLIAGEARWRQLGRSLRPRTHLMNVYINSLLKSHTSCDAIK